MTPAKNVFSIGMRILVARCEIAYHGRATTRLGAGDRVILFKDDGSLCVHAEKGYKPLNYMPGPTTVKEEGDVIRVYRAASDETLVIVVEEVHEDARHELEDDAVLEREDAELQIHGCSSGRPRRSRPASSSSSASAPTDTGPIDLFCRDAEGRTVVVEVKRTRAVAAHVEQLTRYCERVDLDPAHSPCRGILVAPEIAPQAQVMCEARGFALRRARLRRAEGRGGPGAHAVRVDMASPSSEPERSPMPVVDLTAHPTVTTPYGRWQPLNGPLGVAGFGISAIVCDPGEEFDIEHDEAESGQQEAYIVVAGRGTSGSVTTRSRLARARSSRLRIRRPSGATARSSPAPASSASAGRLPATRATAAGSATPLRASHARPATPSRKASISSSVL